MFDIKEEKTKEFFTECLDIATDDFYEVFSERGTKLPMKLNTELLNTLFDSGAMCIVSARKNGTLIGYFVDVVCPDLITCSLIGQHVATYIVPRYRGTTVFKRMLSEMERVLQTRGAKAHHLHFIKGHNEKLPLKCEGYYPLEYVYEKILGDVE